MPAFPVLYPGAPSESRGQPGAPAPLLIPGFPWRAADGPLAIVYYG
jgi:hypothetical protein